MGRTVGREREVLLPISCQCGFPTRAQLVFSFWTKARAHEQCQAGPYRIGLGIAVLSLLIYISPGQFKTRLKVIFSRFLANEDLSCNPDHHEAAIKKIRTQRKVSCASLCDYSCASLCGCSCASLCDCSRASLCEGQGVRSGRVGGTPSQSQLTQTGGGTTPRRYSASTTV